jgi:hypothetical protein
MNPGMLRVSQQVLQKNDIAKRVACEIGNDRLDRNVRGHPASLGPQTERRQDGSGRATIARTA